MFQHTHSYADVFGKKGADMLIKLDAVVLTGHLMQWFLDKLML